MFQNHQYQNQLGRTRLDDGAGFLGRNGIGIQTGIEVHASTSRAMVTLTPISSRGIASGYQEIPAAEIDAFIAKLQQAKAVLAGTTQS